MRPIKNLSKAWISLAFSVLILIQVTAAFSMSVQPAMATTTLVVPDDYASIGAAVGNATQGDTILVRDGVYYENPVVDKAVRLVSENLEGAVVIGEGGIARGGQGVFTLFADGITVEGFTIQSVDYANKRYATGIMLSGNNCTLSGNRIVGTYYGIYGSAPVSATIMENQIINVSKNGIRICGGSQNIISNNLCTGSGQSGAAIDGFLDVISGNVFTDNALHGLGLGASYSVVFGNNFSDNAEGAGIYFGSSDCVVAANTFAQNVWGIFLENSFKAPTNSTFYENNFLDNGVHVVTASTGFGQFWDNGSVGNYWSGISSAEPYTVFADNVDHYPLNAPFTLTADTPQPPMPATPEVQEGTVAAWSFDEVSQDGVTPDSVDGNDVILGGGDTQSMLVAGYEGNAIAFSGVDYGFVAPSSTLDIVEEVTVDAWINVQQLKNVEYNVIFVECVRTTESYPIRGWGLALTGVSPQSSSQPGLGTLRGFMLGSDGVFNEIDTTNSVPLNQWVHVVFVRSTTSGMHIYIDDVEQEVVVFSGDQNPAGQIAQGTECYIGHDSYTIIDNLSISNVAAEPNAQSSSVGLEWWFWAIIAVAAVALVAGAFLFSRRSGKPT
ncbi:MAG: right-handed parallel beta-helix repeat-containing protein [Candidatus Bathyarchaeota archaeon]|nr:right-handed parallel beta-helix repeat-containing protein [Candidatus Bathyarchaeota archaeon]